MLGDHLQIDDIRKALKPAGACADVITPYRDADGLSFYLLDNAYLLKLSRSPMDAQMKLSRVAHMDHTPKLRASGMLRISGDDYNYAVCDYLHGEELLTVLHSLTDAQQADIGAEIVQFLIELHTIKGNAYDLGHYIPTIPQYVGTWRDGHAAYADILTEGIGALDLESDSIRACARAFDYIHTHADALTYQAGPVLLHNDFHPKNIITNDGRLTGVIDWECSQYGEADFELTHLIHWCAFPPQQDKRFDAMLGVIIKTMQQAAYVPGLAERITIYQLEHDMNQMIWRGKVREAERVHHIRQWLDGLVFDMLR